MTTDLDSDLLGLWLDEDTLREEFEAIIAAGWADDEPTGREPTPSRPPVLRRNPPAGWPPSPRHGAHPSPTSGPGTAPARERGPPEFLELCEQASSPQHRGGTDHRF